MDFSQPTHEQRWELGILALLAALSFLFWGMAGARTILGVALLVALPFYLLFGAFRLGESERLAFSFCAAVAAFPSVTYWLGFIMPFTTAIWVASLLWYAAAAIVILIFRKIRKRAPS